jgi:hypothetical protein
MLLPPSLPPLDDEVDEDVAAASESSELSRR